MRSINNEDILEKLKDCGLDVIFKKLLEENCKISSEDSNKLFDLLINRSIERLFSDISLDNLNNIKNIKEKEFESLIKK